VQLAEFGQFDAGGLREAARYAQGPVPQLWVPRTSSASCDLY
jgi:hypothetical protein